MMLSPRLQQIKEKIETKVFGKRTAGEKELLAELTLLETHLKHKDELQEFRESVRKSVTKITSGPGGPCPCCGK